MKFARYCIAICVGGLSALACHTAAEPDVAPEVGIIEFYSDRSTVLTLPATARAGQDFNVVVRTFGNGCVSAATATVRYNGARATLTPYDNDLSRTSPGVACTDILLRPTHTVTLRFPEAGVATIRVEGRREPGSQAASIEGTITITNPF